MCCVMRGVLLSCVVPFREWSACKRHTCIASVLDCAARRIECHRVELADTTCVIDQQFSRRNVVRWRLPLIPLSFAAAICANELEQRVVSCWPNYKCVRITRRSTRIRRVCANYLLLFSSIDQFTLGKVGGAMRVVQCA